MTAASQTLCEDGLAWRQAWSRRHAAPPGAAPHRPRRAAPACRRSSSTRDDPLERYNMPDTLKAQYTAFLTPGRVLYSDMGRVLCSIVERHLRLARHDLPGTATRARRRARFGDGRYQELRNEFHRNARDNFLVELGKHGLGKRDLVRQRELLRARWRRRTTTARCAGSPSASRAPARFVELRFEMDTLVVLSNTPHPLDPARRYAPPPVTLTALRGRPRRRRTIPAASRAPRTRAASRSPRPYVAELRGGSAVTRGAGRERARSRARARLDVVLPAGEGWTHEFARARPSASSISRATRPSTRCSSTRATPTSATARRTRSARRATSTSTTGTALMSSEGRPLLTIVADTCGRHDTLGGACSAESNQVRYALEKKSHAQLPRQLPAGAGARTATA